MLQAIFLVVLTVVLCSVGYFLRPQLASLLMPLFARSAGVSAQITDGVQAASKRTVSVDSLISENGELQKKLAASEALVLDRNQLYEENVALKEQLGRSAEPNRVLATVLVRPSATPYDTLIIDVGSDAGISVGDQVAAGGSLLIGKVSQVFAHTSLVTLYSSPGETYEGFLRGTIPIKVVGQGGGSLVADVPYDAKAVEGDSVTLPLLEANTAFIVEHVEQGQGNASPKVYLRLPISAFDLRFVEVWRGAH